MQRLLPFRLLAFSVLLLKLFLLAFDLVHVLGCPGHHLFTVEPAHKYCQIRDARVLTLPQHLLELGELPFIEATVSLCFFHPSAQPNHRSPLLPCVRF